LDLSFDIHADCTRVINTMQIAKIGDDKDLVLDGEDLVLKKVLLNGSECKHTVGPSTLTVFDVPKTFELINETEIYPAKNTRLEGLYKSGEMLVTQNEPQGFRRITYFLDRPDVMTSYTVKITADKKLYPILLSNGDKVSETMLENNRHQVIWKDPYKKPCYLFALVAGDLGLLKGQFTTRSGKKVNLEIYCSHGKESRCQFALESLIKSMKWDEQRFDREYDLNTYMIVASDDFNAGAMENKGLNIFNSRLVFADPKTASDSDYDNIESVIAHEYFHNWTGNRVTLRDWFNLSLKEGLTVFRDQEFSMDMSDRGLVRIQTVRDLRSSQFPEDAGPNAHPVQPTSCFAVDNFFTSTIYEKGAEVIRMMQTIVGRPGFKKGMDLYFEKFDGKAVTIQDFADCIAKANNQDWQQFERWYFQGGTPRVKVTETFDSGSKEYIVTLTQTCDPTAEETKSGYQKFEFHIPLDLQIFGSKGLIDLDNNPAVTKNSEGHYIANLKSTTQEIKINGINKKPILSINRQFSAPIYLEFDQSFTDSLFLIENDNDSFVRWESAQKIFLNEFVRIYKDCAAGNQPVVNPDILKLFSKILNDGKLVPRMLALLITLPDDGFLIQNLDSFNSTTLSKARSVFESAIAKANESEFLNTYQNCFRSTDVEISQKAFGRRKIQNACLGYLTRLPKHQGLAFNQLKESQLMNDQQAAFGLLLETERYRTEAISLFFNRWNSESLVLNKWFALIALSDHQQTFEDVQKMTHHKEFNLKNPNRVYSLLANFAENHLVFHDLKKPTYNFYCQMIKAVDELNPAVASRLAQSFDVLPKLDQDLQTELKKNLKWLVDQKLSSNTFELISKQLA
jgi:aminopeptidase N